MSLRRVCRVLADQAFKQQLRSRRVIVCVQFDVACEVTVQRRRLVLDKLIRLQDVLEHRRDDVLAAMQECRGDAMGRGAQCNVQGGADETGHARGGSHFLQGCACVQALALQGNEVVDRAGVRTDFGHGFEVQLEVAAIALPGVLVRFFTQHDLVDQPCGVRVSGGEPGKLRAGQVLLQAFGECHEIPDSKYMAFHEKL